MKTKIAFLGCDGSGKSTLIDFMSKKLKEKGMTSRVVVMGWKDFENPLVKAISKTYLKQKEKRKTKDDKLGRFRARGFFFYLIYYIELWQRYLKVLFSNADFILMDRYFYDELAFAAGFSAKIFRIITPKPDLAVIVKTPLKTMKRRGYDYDKDKYNQFYDKISRIAGIGKSIEVNGSKPLNKLYKEVIESVR